jgi:hypothetical protein
VQRCPVGQATDLVSFIFFAKMKVQLQLGPVGPVGPAKASDAAIVRMLATSTKILCFTGYPSTRLLTLLRSADHTEIKL